MSSLSRSIGLAVTASALMLLTACGGGGTTESAPATAVADPVVTFPPLTRTSAAPTTDAPAPQTATVVVTETVQGDAGSGSASSAVDPERYRTSGSQSGRDFAFVSPTGNVGCSISADGSVDDSVGCQASSTVAPEDGSICPPPATETRVRSAPTGSSHDCARPDETFAAPGAVVLDYGQTLRIGGVECTSDEQRGVTCTTGGTGFQLSRDVNRVF